MWMFPVILGLNGRLLLGTVLNIGSKEIRDMVDCKNYYQFLLRMKEDVHLTLEQEAVLSFISLELMNGKRIAELLLLQELLQRNGTFSKAAFVELLDTRNVFHDADVERSVERVLSLAFFTASNQKKYGQSAVVTLQNGTYVLNEQLRQQLTDGSTFMHLVSDAIAAGLLKAKAYQVDQRFTLYQRYTRKDVCRLLGWESDVSSTVYGYRIRQNACPIFVTYAKSDEIDASINYADRFINTAIFQWYTRHNVKLESKEVREILRADTTIHLFIKKNDDEGSDFYYFGEVTVDDYRQEDFQAKDKVEPIVRMQLKLAQPAQYDKYLLFEK